MPEQQPPRPRPPAADARGVTTSCPRCGDLHLASTAFRLVVCVQDPGRSFYQFFCPRCTGLVTRHATERTVLGLSRCGVPVGSLPAEALEERSGAVIDVDDLLDLMIHLQDDDVIASAVSHARG